jgi:methionyl-tRNA synthetase
MKYLITSALPYINGIKHLGNLVGSMLPADIYARFLRLNQKEVLYICATDEHGTPAELAALAADLSVEAYCERQHRLQAEIYGRFGLSFDYFGRTSSNANKELTQHFYQRLDQNGYIEERSIRQMYSLEDARFLPDRYVIGTCPHCGYTAARGDQCENCTRVLDPTDLLAPRSAISNSERLEIRESKHLFLRLPLLSDAVRSWVDEHAEWPLLSKSIALKWLNEGLQDRGITRDLAWGVSVPRPGFEGKVFYVWFDAPIGYIAATKDWATSHSDPDAWRAWWLSEDVRYSQFMAKDNLPFHTVMWPAMILGTGEAWKQADYIKGFNWLNYYGGKFSTSQGRGVFLDQAIDMLPPDYWRYTLMAMAPESNDSAFSWELLQTRINKDLVGTLGNFVNRTLTFVTKNFGSGLPEGGETGEAEAKLHSQCETLVTRISESLENLEFRKAIDDLYTLWTVGNQYIDAGAPWTLIKTDRAAAAQVVRTCINLMDLYARISAPFIPFTAEAIAKALHLSETERARSWPTTIDLTELKAGHSFEVPPLLFRRIEDAEVQGWREKFGS